MARKANFKLFYDNEKDNNTSTQESTLEDYSSFSSEREKIRRFIEKSNNSELKVDYSDFSNHVFFDSAESKTKIAVDRVLDDYPFYGSSRDKDLYRLSGSGFEDYIFDEWPRYVGYVTLNGLSQYITGSDYENSLLLGTGSVIVSAYVDPVIIDENLVFQVGDRDGTSERNGYDFFFSGTNDPHLVFSIFSASTVYSVSASYSEYTGSFHNIAGFYDYSSASLSLYIDGDKKDGLDSLSLGPIEHSPSKFWIGQGLSNVPLRRWTTYSGSIADLRVYHTASEKVYKETYFKPIDSEGYVKFYYKFNEGIVGSEAIDRKVIDYSSNFASISKRALDGKIINYDTNVRVSGTAMPVDPGDPILYPTHSSVVAFTSSYINSGSLYDQENNNNIFRLIPLDMLIADEDEQGLLTSLALVMARFFDELKLYVDQFDNLRITNETDYDQTPNKFLPYVSKYLGWKVAEHFDTENPLQFFFGDKVFTTGSLDTSLNEIRNEFWKRTLNNLPYIYKTKGNNSSVDALLNVLGINKYSLSFKEYGYSTKSTIDDLRVYKEKPVPIMGFATGSSGLFTGSSIHVPELHFNTDTSYTVECFAQLPYASASYSNTVTTGSLWSLSSGSMAVSLWYNITDIDNNKGKLILTGSNEEFLSSSEISIFDGEFLYIAAGLDTTKKPFIEIRDTNNGEIELSYSYTGDSAFNGVYTGSFSDFYMGAKTSADLEKYTQGFFHEYKLWDRQLSASEIKDHALHPESVSVIDPTISGTLIGHWPLSENKSSDSSGDINGVKDFSRNKLVATGSNFPLSENVYDKFLIQYSYLSPSIDLKWSDSKIRTHDRTYLDRGYYEGETNEVSLEFNYVDALNEDISKIFATLDKMNNIIGEPINKYRNEYTELEKYRRVYFERLGDSLNFNKFFGLFQWFDKKISEAIRQVLPSRAKFIGGEFVVDSHFLERNKYAYKYPVFRTPKTVADTAISASAEIDGKLTSTRIIGGDFETPRTLEEYENNKLNGTYLGGTNIKLYLSGSKKSVSVDGSKQKKIITYFGSDNEYKHDKDMVFISKKSGDTRIDVMNSNSGINHRNESARYELMKKDRDNEE